MLARRRHVEGRVQDRIRSAQARRDHGRPARDRSALPRAARGTDSPRCRAPCRGPATDRGSDDDRRPGSPRRSRTANAPPRLARAPPAQPGAGHRPARSRPRAGARLRLGGGHLRARPDRPRAPPRRGEAPGRARLRAPAQRRSLGPDGDHEAPLRRLLHPHQVDDAAGGCRRRRSHRRGRLRPSRPRAP